MRSSLPLLRQLHLYLGVFTAPAILFFAFSGALQSFGLNDRSQDGSYVPPHWLSVMAQIHKKQSSELPQRRLAPAQAPAQGPSQTAGRESHKNAETRPPQIQVQTPPPRFPEHNPLPMRIFFLVVCAGLVTSTLTGLWMSWKYRRSKALLVGLFLAGLVIPLILLRV